MPNSYSKPVDLTYLTTTCLDIVNYCSVIRVTDLPIIVNHLTDIKGSGFATGTHSLKKTYEQANSAKTYSYDASVVTAKLDSRLPKSGIYVSDDLLHSDDTLISDTNAAYTKEKSIFCQSTGIIRVKFDLKDSGGGNASQAKIYKNGVAHGTERDNVGVDWTTFSEDLEFTFTDTIELWCKTGASTYQIQNFRLYGVLLNDFTTLTV